MTLEKAKQVLKENGKTRFYIAFNNDYVSIKTYESPEKLEDFIRTTAQNMCSSLLSIEIM